MRADLYHDEVFIVSSLISKHLFFNMNIIDMFPELSVDVIVKTVVNPMVLVELESI